MSAFRTILEKNQIAQAGVLRRKPYCKIHLLFINRSNKAASPFSGGAKVSCILCHRGVQLILAYSWARSAILVAGKGREVFISSVSSLSFLFLFLPCPSLSSLLLSLPSLFSLSLGDDTK